MRRFIYHYCIERKYSNPAMTIDGILILEKPIDSMNRLREAKEMILDEKHIQYADERTGWSIVSLSFLHREQEEEEIRVWPE